MDSHFDNSTNILGHGKIIDYLKKSIKNERLTHAYLFLGRSGLGKRTVTLHFFQSILCHSFDRNIGNIPCQKCLACREFSRGQYPDFYEIGRDPDKKNISIEQIRNLRHKLSLKSALAGYKFVLINEIECLTSEAANSFLKTLEEPAQKTIIVLNGANEEAIPKTVLSRCQVIRFRFVSQEEIRQYLKDVKNLNSLKLKIIAKLSGGRPGRAINFAENPVILEQEERKTAQFIELINSSLSHRLAEISRVKYSGDLADGISPLLDTWQTVSRDLLLNKLGLHNQMMHENLKIASKNIEKKNIAEYLREILEFSLMVPGLIKNNINPKIILENYILKI